LQWAEGYGADGKIRAKALVVAVKSAGAVFVRASIDLGKLTKVAQVYFSDMKKIVRQK
jgi:prolyl-tRNA editing enzyme YbaK/EbsC (Cys-tRNA(Pro) deacylase)